MSERWLSEHMVDVGCLWTEGTVDDGVEGGRGTYWEGGQWCLWRVVVFILVIMLSSENTKIASIKNTM